MTKPSSIPRSFAAVLGGTLLLGACVAADDAAPAEIRVELRGDDARAWSLTGPADEAPALVEALRDALALDEMAAADASVRIVDAETSIDELLDPAADLAQIEQLADAHGFAATAVEPSLDAAGGKADDQWTPKGDRGRIARAEVFSQFGTIYDSFVVHDKNCGRWTVRTYTGTRWDGRNDIRWGDLPGDRPLTGDFDGDGASDYVIYRGGVWWIRGSRGGSWSHTHGGATDIPVPGDYDADQVTDVAYYRPSTTEWVIRPSSLNRGGPATTWTRQLGYFSRPVPGDYDGDDRTDVAIFQDGTFTIKQSTNPSAPAISHYVGNGTPVPGDYDNDGKFDPAVLEADGDWLVRESGNGYRLAPIWRYGFGTTDVPAAGDIDGDGRMDYNVWRPSTKVFYSLTYAHGEWTPKDQAGNALLLPGHQPVMAIFNPQPTESL